MGLQPGTRDEPKLSRRYQPSASGYLGYIDVGGTLAARHHPNAVAVADQPVALLYNAPQHCSSECAYRRFLAFERDYLDRPGEFELVDEGGLLRDCHWRSADAHFRTRRTPSHYEYAPLLKLLIDGRSYCLRDALSQPGFSRSLDETEETQRLTIFSAMDPATPVGFFSFHRKVGLRDGCIRLYLLPDFLYVAPPFRGLGYGLTLLSGVLEIWEAELHRQAARIRDRIPMQVHIDGGSFASMQGRRTLTHIVESTRETLTSCQTYWGTSVRSLTLDGPLAAAARNEGTSTPR
jgi:GNAT superfamily N-acetyltransferase